MNTPEVARRDVTLLELLDRLIDHGVTLSGDVMVSVADVDLIYVGLRLVLVSAERAFLPGGAAQPSGQDRVER